MIPVLVFIQHRKEDKAMPKVLFQLYIDVDQYNYVARKSKETGRSRASIVRELIKESMKQKKEKAK